MSSTRYNSPRLPVFPLLAVLVVVLALCTTFTAAVTTGSTITVAADQLQDQDKFPNLISFSLPTTPADGNLNTTTTPVQFYFTPTKQPLGSDVVLLAIWAYKEGGNCATLPPQPVFGADEDCIAYVDTIATATAADATTLTLQLPRGANPINRKIKFGCTIASNSFVPPQFCSHTTFATTYDWAAHPNMVKAGSDGWTGEQFSFAPYNSTAEAATPTLYTRSDVEDVTFVESFDSNTICVEEYAVRGGEYTFLWTPRDAYGNTFIAPTTLTGPQIAFNISITGSHATADRAVLSCFANAAAREAARNANTDWFITSSATMDYPWFILTASSCVWDQTVRGYVVTLKLQNVAYNYYSAGSRAALITMTPRVATEEPAALRTVITAALPSESAWRNVLTPTYLVAATDQSAAFGPTTPTSQVPTSFPLGLTVNVTTGWAIGESTVRTSAFPSCGEEVTAESGAGVIAPEFVFTQADATHADSTQSHNYTALQGPYDVLDSNATVSSYSWSMKLPVGYGLAWVLQHNATAEQGAPLAAQLPTRNFAAPAQPDGSTLAVEDMLVEVLTNFSKGPWQGINNGYRHE